MMKTSIVIAVLALAVSLVAIGRPGNASADLSERKAAAKEELQRASDKIDKQLDAISDKLADAGKSARQKLTDRKSRLEKLQGDIRDSMDKRADQSGESWKNFKSNVDDMLTKIQNDLS